MKRRSIFAVALCAAYALGSSPLPAADKDAVAHIGTQPYEVAFQKITVSDVRRSYDFYTRTIGLKIIDLPGPPPVIDEAKSKDYFEVCLNFSGSTADPFLCLVKIKGRVPTAEAARLAFVAFKVPDAHALTSRIKAAGLTVHSEAPQAPESAVGFAADPDGYTLEIVQAPSVIKAERAK